MKAPRFWMVVPALLVAGAVGLAYAKLPQPPMDDAAKAKAAEAKGKDDDVLRMIPDRSEKFQAPAFLRPEARWTQTALPGEFQARRDRTLDFIRTTQEDLRTRTLPHPVMKTLDAYQWILLLSAHTERHRRQIEEVKSHPGFPKR